MLANFQIKFATFPIKFVHLANRVWQYLLLIGSIVRLSSGEMASKLTRKKKKKKEEPPNDDGVNLSVECVKISKEKNTKKEPPNDVDVNLSVECVKISQEKNTKKEPPNDVDVKKMYQQQDVDKMEKSKNQKKITALKLDNNRTFFFLLLIFISVQTTFISGHQQFV